MGKGIKGSFGTKTVSVKNLIEIYLQFKSGVSNIFFLNSGRQIGDISQLPC